MISLIRYCLVSVTCAAIALSACSSNGSNADVPRPRAYVRMELPDSTYTTVDINGLHLERNAAATHTIGTTSVPGAAAIDITYPGLNAIIYITDTPVGDDNAAEVLDNRNERMMRNTGDNTTELIDMAIQGGQARITTTPTGSPTPVQFIATQPGHIVSGQAFVDAAATVRSDSLQPLVDMLRRDIIHMVSTLSANNL